MVNGARLVALLAVLVLLLAVVVLAQIDVNTIIQRSVAVNLADWKASPSFDYCETDREAHGTKTYRVLMIDGSTHHRLIAVNGRPLSPEKDAEEEAKLREEIAKRRNESDKQRARRIGEYQKELKRNETFVRDIGAGFDFKLLGEEQLDGRQVYVLAATPRPDFHPSSTQAKVLTGMEGKLWIDKQTFQWVKVEAEVTRPVSIAGFLARVEPGTRFELENKPVTGDIWLPSHFVMKSKAKVLEVFDKKSEADETYFAYEKSSEAQSTSAENNTGTAHR